MPDRRATRAIVALMAMVVAIGPRTAEAASRTVEVENVRVGFEERFKVGAWTPVWVQLRGGVDGLNGFLEIVAQDEDGTPTTFRQPLQVAPGATQRVTTYVRPGSLDSEFATLRFIDGKTGRKAAPDAPIGSLTGSRPPEYLSTDDYQVLSLGRASGVKSIPTLPGFNATKQNAASTAGGRAREVSIASPAVSDDLLPGRWYGYDAVDTVLVDTNDKELLATLSSGRGEALRQWVERGGHLVVAVSGNWQAVVDSPIGAMLPARVTGQSQVNPFDALESFTGGSRQVAFENTPTRAAKLEDIEARGGKVLASTVASPLVVRGPYGFGRVTLVGLDVDTKPFADWPDRALFWVKALDLKVSTLGVDAQKPGQRFIRQDISDLATLVRRALDQFPGVTLVPFGWVAGFIVLYILLIGPGDYFFLKKVVKRMELTWITFPLIVVVVSLLAYYAAYVVKGTDLRINQIDVVDVDAEAKVARGTSWVNLFSPQNRDYSVAMVPILPDRASPDDPNAIVAPLPGTEVMTTWFGAPEGGLRGMNTRNRGMGLSGRGYEYAPLGKVDALEGVRVGIWSTKGFVSRWFGPAPGAGAMLDVDLQPAGTDRLAGTITNRLPYPLEEVIVAYGKQVYYDIGTIAPGATIQIDTKLDRSLGNYLDEAQKRYVPENYYVASAAPIDRAALLRGMMFYASDPNGEIIPSRIHRELDLTGQLALGRPMLVAKVARPAAQLVLGNAPGGNAKTQRTSLLRVILPLKKEAAASKTR